MKKINWSLVAITMLIVLASCSSADKNAALVPKDAAIVVHLNTGSLSSKLPWEEIRKSNWFMEMTRDEKDSLKKKILEDPGNSGMDTKEGFFVFARRETSGASYLGFTGKMKDAAVFESFNKKVSNGKNATNKDNLKFIQMNEKASVTWDDNRFLYLLELGFSPSFKMDSGQQVYEPPVKPDFQDVAKRIFNYKKDSLLISDDRFSSLLKDDGDVHFWSNAEELSMNNANLGFLSLLRTDVYFRESVTAATLSFDKGKIVIHSKTYSNKEMEELMRKYSGDNINTSYVQRIPSDRVIGLLVANYKPEGLKQFLKIGGLDGLVNSFLGKYDLTLDEIVAASKGDLLITVTDMGMKKKMISLGKGMDSLPITTPSAEVLVAMSVNKKEPFDKLAAILKGLAESDKFPRDIAFKVSNDLFVGGSNSTLVDQYLSGGKKDFPFLSKISGHPIAFYLDVNKLFTSFNAKIDDTVTNSVYKATIDTWKDVVMTGGEFKDNALQQNVEVNLVDENTNSLQQLNTFFEKISQTRKKPF